MTTNEHDGHNAHGTRTHDARPDDARAGGDHARRFGRIGLWSPALHSGDPARRTEIAEAAAELDESGYGTLWIGASPGPAQAEPVLAATSRVTVGTSIMSIWQHRAEDVAAQHARLNSAHGGRFVLGLGVSHAEAAKDEATREELRRRPYTAMRRYLDELDAAPRPVPAGERALAALGPRMLELSRDRAVGALPYLVTAEHTARAREILGPDALLAPELKVVLDPDLKRARTSARAYLERYLAMANYRNSWLRLGFAQDDLTGGGSDRLLDAVYALGDAEAVRTKVASFFDAGADHVALQVVTEEPFGALPRAEWRTLAEALLPW
ncbi:LLM class F420-dependent oxidoreductase [Streptomyces sp. HNM0575]|uniref:LLM class F420-dependent oxidoreductase n=1 Tax=Streptomyces sp. HNM0575 TaxID=2716338 RepID=UPI00145FCCD0|nr:LLM class F420-dependent oxidoreductase [Streptomyces sp. HNM0575]NLU72929.1 LLM class F420-dependent oxidoreductase [Streptomyces sp. HNM0575]